ncbi:hypothetical protein V7112_11630 [Bacillus sp. JJ1566]|uniref:hypothetical protein n=1 Tax=Bacillus sp. JJ1566 TaxID=3122961 RepID=UPI0030005B52
MIVIAMNFVVVAIVSCSHQKPDDLDLRVKGPNGPRGETGPTGPKGEPGPPGILPLINPDNPCDCSSSFAINQEITLEFRTFTEQGTEIQTQSGILTFAGSTLPKL